MKEEKYSDEGLETKKESQCEEMKPKTFFTLLGTGVLVSVIFSHGPDIVRWIISLFSN